MRLTLLAALLLTACPSSDDGTKTDDTGTTGPTTGCQGLECYVFVTEPYVGDLTCFDGTNWIEQTVGAGCVQDLSVDGTVEDFQTEEPVGTAYLNVWYNDDISSSPDVETQASEEGDVSVTAPSCTPIAYKSFTPADMGQEGARDTYEVHQVYGYQASGSTSETFNSVSIATSTLIPALIGVNWDNAGTAIIAGTAYDCAGSGIMNAQVYIHDAAGNSPEWTEDNPFGVYYFANGLPTDNESQAWTNDDGLWASMNVPPGDWIVDMYGWDGTAHVLLGSTSLRANAGAVYISNIYSGIEDGIGYPASCLATCE